jgi:hypothetical protein
MGRKELAIMKYGITFDMAMTQALKRDPNAHIELRYALPIHPLCKYTWSVRMLGEGVYMGPALEDYGESYGMCITFDDPDTFVPEN